MALAWNVFAALLIGAVTALLGLLLVIRRNYDYWKKRNVRHRTPALPFGTSEDYFTGRKNIGEVSRMHYEAYPEEKFVGCFHLSRPVLVIRDPELIKHVLVKDYAHFRNRDRPFNYKSEPLLANLFHMNNDEWKVLRQKMTPAFSSSKMKNMFPLILARGEEFSAYIFKHLDIGESIFDVRKLMSKYTKGVVASCAFGIDIKSMTDEYTPFTDIERFIFEGKYTKILRILARIIFPRLANLLKVRLYNYELEEFMLKTIKDIIAQRKGEVSQRNDMIDLMIEMKNKGSISTAEYINGDESKKKVIELEVTDALITAQAFVFFAAGFETSSTASAFALYELALNPDIQERLYDEIVEVLGKYDNKITYENIQEMEYLDKVFHEILRKYPSLTNLTRDCTMPYTFPGTNLKVDTECSIVVPVYALHRDAKHFPDPERFDPERHSAEGKKTRHPFSYLPFGDGPRNCIGSRFGKFQSFVGIVTVVKNFKVIACDQTDRKIILNPTRSTLVHMGNLGLKFEKR